MKFTCESCGKRFASVDEPLPGRIYKIRCRRCGQLISVQAPVPWEEPADLAPEAQLVTEDASESRAAMDGALRREALAAGFPEPGPVADGTEEVPIDLGLSDEYPLIRRKRRLRNAVAPFLVTGIAGIALLGLVVVIARGTSPRAPAPAPAPAPGPELGLVLLPSEAADPFAASAAPDPTRLADGAAAAVPRFAAPPPHPSSPRPPAAARTRPAAATTQSPAARRQPAPWTGVAFERGGPGPAAPAAPAGPAVDPGLAAALLAKEDVAVRALPADLTEMRAILDGRRAVLLACFDGADGTGGSAAWAGRTAQLVVRVESGGVASGRLADAALEPTAIASCLRRTVARITFPAFSGEPVELGIPVALPGR